ncbi:FAD-dependent oxidoreductase [Thiohalomonas denitrificans]|uniref:FAD-dependent oxidoreductase n=1 Tax=Thiohalomonas denitrificans TaxID=415747 RepID=UPI0026EF171B|nr:FAD-dependent oxidoreductase [Thiohalomonas denitrificans]
MSAEPHVVPVDVAVFGGGVAGLWLLGRLRAEGYRAVLLEANALGSGQTRYAQGILHGGTKYALTGKLSDSAQAVAAMPGLWRDCLDGKGELDLTRVRVLSPNQFLWSTANLTSRMAGFFASRLMRGRTESLPEMERPPVFRHSGFRGQVYRLDEPVLDTASLIEALSAPHRDSLIKYEWPQGFHLSRCDADWRIDLHDGNGQQLRVEAKRLVLTAGRGNRDLLEAAGYTRPEMQLRPLVMVAARGKLPEGVYAHCLGASSNPRITISTHRDADGRVVWYLGGQLAEEGVGRTREEQIAAAQRELHMLLPWVDQNGLEWTTLDIERAEPLMPDGRRPDTAFAGLVDSLIAAWPTKLVLAPRLAADILRMLKDAGVVPQTDRKTAEVPEAWPRPVQAPLPWQEESRWS